MLLRNLFLFFASSLITWRVVSVTLPPEPSSQPSQSLSEASGEEPLPTPHVQAWTRLCGPHASEGLDSLIEEVSGDTGVEPALLAAVMFKESTCRPEAIGGAGEIGLTQIHPRVWTRHLKKHDFIESAEDLFDPEVNLRCSAHILGGHLEKTDGDVWKSLRRYNGAGPKARLYADRVFATYLALSEGGL